MFQERLRQVSPKDKLPSSYLLGPERTGLLDPNEQDPESDL
jgi:hypothetical protein